MDEKLRKQDDPGAPYTPHLRAVHSSSRGYVQRVPGSTANRLHEFLSRHESHAYLLFAWRKDEFSNIREQFPLPLRLTQAIALQEGIKHPWNRFEDEAAVMSVDFMLTKRGGGWLAVDFKEKKDKTRKRTKEKLKLSQLALSLAGVPHVVMTEDDLPTAVVRNHSWLRIHVLPFDPPPLSESEIALAEPRLRQILSDGRTQIFEAAVQVANSLGLETANLARACYWLVANGRWRVDLRTPIGPDYPLKFIDSK